MCYKSVDLLCVLKEVEASGKSDFAAEQLSQQQWLKIATDIPVDLRVAAWDLGRGESEVISFALLNPSHCVVLDDRETRYFRPTEVETLLGDPTKARENWAKHRRSALES